MKNRLPLTMLAAMLIALAVVGTTNLNAQVLVTSNIATSTTWTSNNVYRLQQQIYVLPGATLTIEEGTVIASTAGLGGSLAVCKGAQIFVQGTQDNPVIMTSTNDTATWVGGDSKTGTWREAANEWGNLTLMGAGYVSENATVGNVAIPSASNVAAMEGLIADFSGDTKVLYGGGNDDDDSGSISYLSLRYTGRVIGLGNELNGLSLGGIGRDTDIHHVEVMNNVDDGIEIWGGTVNLKHVSIWNIGDDSFDIDQGWRGKAQFIFIVQGHSLDASQGSGVGDNCFETDGAEDSDWQPVTTSVIYNATVIGQPVSGDHGTAWRDNARVQYHNCVFTDVGEQVVKFDNVDGDGANGYGFNGTLSWANTWTTPYTATSTVNAPANPAAFYNTQVSGNLAQITDSVFFGNANASAYTEAIARGVFAGANNNVMEPVNSPITTVTRSAPVVKGGKVILPVTYVDPRPANDALTSVGSAPNDGFFTPAQYRGAFAPGENWLCNWTASQAFGMSPDPVAGPGQSGTPGINYFDVNQARNLNCSLVGSTIDPNGPFYATVAAGGQIQLTFDASPNTAFAFFSGPLNPNVADFSVFGVGQMDVGTTDTTGDGVPESLVLIGDGSAPTTLTDLFFATDATGQAVITAPMSPFVPMGTVLGGFQALFFSSPTVKLSNAVQITIN